MSAEPLVSVLMPAYNSAPFIGAAIESLLAQSYSHWELLVIDDGSTDDTASVVKAYQERSPRVQVAARPHRGIAASRNYGLELAQGEYLAWLDSDDLALPNRLELQVAELQCDPKLTILGSAYQTIDENSVPQGVHLMPETDTSIRWHSLFHCPFAQSTVMLRLEVLRLNKLSYDLSMPPVEDYDLWSRLLLHGQGRNLVEPLVQYRKYPTQASQQNHSKVWDLASQIAHNNLSVLGAALSTGQVQNLRNWYYHFPGRFSAADQPAAEVFLDILNRFSLQPGLDATEVKYLRGRWLGRLARAALRSGRSGWYSWLARRLTPDDYRSILAYLRGREKL